MIAFFNFFKKKKILRNKFNTMKQKLLNRFIQLKQEKKNQQTNDVRILSK